MTTKKVGKLTETLGPYWLSFGGRERGGGYSGLRRHWHCVTCFLLCSGVVDC